MSSLAVQLGRSELGEICGTSGYSLINVHFGWYSSITLASVRGRWERVTGRLVFWCIDWSLACPTVLGERSPGFLGVNPWSTHL